MFISQAPDCGVPSIFCSNLCIDTTPIHLAFTSYLHLVLRVRCLVLGMFGTLVCAVGDHRFSGRNSDINFVCLIAVEFPHACVFGVCLPLFSCFVVSSF